MFSITLLYSALLGMLMAVLSIRVPIRRGLIDVPYGDGEDEVLATRIRAFGNFIEYVPMVLVLMALLEASRAVPAALHGMGVALLLARLLHAVAYRGRTQLTLAQKAGRGMAAMTTWLVLCFGAGYALPLSVG